MDKNELKGIIEKTVDATWMDEDALADNLTGAIWSEIGVILDYWSAQKAYTKAQEDYNGHFAGRNDPNMTKADIETWKAEFDRLRAAFAAAMNTFMKARDALLKAGK